MGFLIPIVLIYYPSISLVSGFEWLSFIWIMARLPVAIWLIATGFIGCELDRLSVVERVLRTIAAVAMLITEPTIQIGGFGFGLAIIVVHRWRRQSATIRKV